MKLKRQYAWFHADQAKARKAIPALLNLSALEVLKKQLGHCDITAGLRYPGLGGKIWDFVGSALFIEVSGLNHVARKFS